MHALDRRRAPRPDSGRMSAHAYESVDCSAEMTLFLKVLVLVFIAVVILLLLQITTRG